MQKEKCDHAREGDNLYVNPSTGQRHCRQCYIAKARRWQEANIEKRDAAIRKFDKSEKGRAARRAYRKTKSGRAHKARYNRKHGVTNHRRRAKHYGVPYEHVIRAKVFERDGWRCQLCRVTTPSSLNGTTHHGTDHGRYTWRTLTTTPGRGYRRRRYTAPPGQRYHHVPYTTTVDNRAV